MSSCGGRSRPGGRSRLLRGPGPGPLPSSLWKLDLCTTVLPQIEKLLQSKYERYVWGSHTGLTAGTERGRTLLRDNGKAPQGRRPCECAAPRPRPSRRGHGGIEPVLPPALCLPRLSLCTLLSVYPSVCGSIRPPLKLRADRLHLPETDPAAVSAPDHGHPGGAPLCGCGHQPGGEVRGQQGASVGAWGYTGVGAQPAC